MSDSKTNRKQLRTELNFPEWGNFNNFSLPGYLRSTLQPGSLLRPGAGAEAGGEEPGGAGGGQAGGAAAEAGGGEAEEDRAGQGRLQEEVKKCDGKEEL